jgi:hypothetical protein
MLHTKRTANTAIQHTSAKSHPVKLSRRRVIIMPSAVVSGLKKLGWLPRLARAGEMVGSAGIEPAVRSRRWFTATLYTL